MTRTSRIDLATGEGSLAIDSSGTFCQPGRSGESHAGPSSYGHPGRFSMVFTVNGTSSTGIFENASGGGTEEMSFNGGVGRWRLSGTVPLH